MSGYESPPKQLHFFEVRLHDKQTILVVEDGYQGTS